MADDATVTSGVGRIIVLLANGRVPRELLPVGPSDVVLALGDVAPDCMEAEVRTVGTPGAALQQEAAAGLADAIGGLPESVARLSLLAFANDLHAYFVRPAIAVSEALLVLMDARPSAPVFVVHARRRSHDVPLVGFATIESPRGSRALLGACIARQLSQQPSIAGRAEFLPVRGDVLCNEGLRALLVRSMDAAMRAKFVCSLLLPRWRGRRGSGRDAADGDGPVFIVRAVHQARFARGIGDALDRIGAKGRRAVVLPQFSQGGSAGPVDELRSGGGSFEIVAPGPARIRAAAAAARRDAKALRAARRTSIELPLSVEGKALRFRFEGLCTELSRLRVFLLYRNLLVAVLRGMKATRLVNFELVGRMAGLDRFAAEEAGCELRTVQTAVVSEVPHPVFPFSNVFYADGPDTAARLARIGGTAMGKVRYAGSTLPLLPLRESVAITDIAFFTQPYEPEITSAIIAALGLHCRAGGGALRVKLHPRDNAARYRAVIAEYEDVLEILGPGSNPADAILQSDLCVTRTSSVAKEALACGRPIVLCLWSELDRSIRADYADPGFPGHLAHDESRLAALLGNPGALRRSAELLRGHVFSGSGIDGLAASIAGGQA